MSVIFVHKTLPCISNFQFDFIWLFNGISLENHTRFIVVEAAQITVKIKPLFIFIIWYFFLGKYYTTVVLWYYSYITRKKMNYFTEIWFSTERRNACVQKEWLNNYEFSPLIWHKNHKFQSTRSWRKIFSSNHS